MVQFEVLPLFGLKKAKKITKNITEREPVLGTSHLQRDVP